MFPKYKRPRRPSPARIKAVLCRYERSADELLAVVSALEANGVFSCSLTNDYELICEARNRAQQGRT